MTTILFLSDTIRDKLDDPCCLLSHFSHFYWFPSSFFVKEIFGNDDFQIRILIQYIFLISTILLFSDSFRDNRDDLLCLRSHFNLIVDFQLFFCQENINQLRFSDQIVNPVYFPVPTILLLSDNFRENLDDPSSRLSHFNFCTCFQVVSLSWKYLAMKIFWSDCWYNTLSQCKQSCSSLIISETIYTTLFPAKSFLPFLLVSKYFLCRENI